MNPITVVISKYKTTYNHFGKWLYEHELKDKVKYHAFFKANEHLQIPYIIKYLELWEVNILEALCYYNCLSSNKLSYQNLIKYMIEWEFYRIENKKEINYTPF